MNEIIKLFDIPYEILKENETHRRVYSDKGIAPCVCARVDSAKIVVEKDEINCIDRWDAKTPIN